MQRSKQWCETIDRGAAESRCTGGVVRRSTGSNTNTLKQSDAEDKGRRKRHAVLADVGHDGSSVMVSRISAAWVSSECRHERTGASYEPREE